MSEKLFTTSGDLFADVQKLSREKTDLTAEQLFSSDPFRNHVQITIDQMTGRYGQKIRFVLDPFCHTACTDGNVIMANPRCSLVTGYTLLMNQFCAMMGLIYHEIGHCIFLDFASDNAALAGIRVRGEFYGDEPAAASPGERADLEELKAAMADPAYRAILSSIYSNLDNIVSDVHDENALTDKFGSCVGECLGMASGALRTATPPLEEDESDPKKDDLSIMTGLILQMARFGSVVVADEDSLRTSGHVRALDKITPLLLSLRYEDRLYDRFTKMNRIVLFLWPYIRQAAENASGSEEPGDTEEALQRVEIASRRDLTRPDGEKPGSGSRPATEGTGTAERNTDTAEDPFNAEHDADAAEPGAGTPGQNTDTDPGTDTKEHETGTAGPGPDSGGSHGADPYDNEDDEEDAGAGPSAENGGASDGADENQDSGAAGRGGQRGSALKTAPLPALTPEGAGRILDAIRKAAEGAGTTPAPVRRTGHAWENGNQSCHIDVPPRTGTGTGDTVDEALARSFRKIAAETGEIAAAKITDSKLTANIRAEIQAADLAEKHKGIPLTVSRPDTDDLTDEDREAYEGLLSEVKGYSRRMQKDLSEILKDRGEEYEMDHRLYGPILKAKDAYRPDGRRFAAKKLPDDLPDLAVAVLVDQSGSMEEGNKIGNARSAAVLLHDFCLGLRVPVHIAGHQAGFKDVYYNVFADFDAVGDYDRYRLMKMTCGGRNRDGMAVQIAADRLSRRPEAMKLLIVISDGLPNHYRYGGEEAERDIRETVRKARRGGIEVVGAAIDADRDAIKRVYGDGFLNITRLGDLPKALVNVVRKRILR